jgi:hypothetical protein
LCGIFGFIGVSKDPKVTYDLLNKLFVKTEPRGTDASGFYGCSVADGSIMYDKEPKKSSEYIKQDIWQKDVPAFIQGGVDLFIGHCRATSVGGGPERINKNNHPHVSDDRRVAMVHNGKIPEFSALKGRYSIESDCDSEILLRMFESSRVIAKERETQLKEEFPTMSTFLAERLLGMKEIFSRVNYGAMAVAIAERGDDNSRYLWLFRDEERPLWVIDMRKTLGQIFFCSTAEIWRSVIEDTPSAKDYVTADHVIIEFPPYQVWLLSTDENEEGPNKPWQIRKFKITKTKHIDHWQAEDEDDKLNFKKPVEVSLPPMKVLCRLKSDESVPPDLKEEPTTPTVPAGEKKKVGNPARNSVNNGHTLPPRSDAVSREPGEEELKNGVVVTAQDLPFEGDIDFELFRKNVDGILGDLTVLKKSVHDEAARNHLSNRELSQIIDQFEVIRSLGVQSGTA